jgi:hypothetical protein
LPKDKILQTSDINPKLSEPITQSALIYLTTSSKMAFFISQAPYHLHMHVEKEAQTRSEENTPSVVSL